MSSGVARERKWFVRVFVGVKNERTNESDRYRRWRFERCVVVGVPFVFVGRRGEMAGRDDNDNDDEDDTASRSR